MFVIDFSSFFFFLIPFFFFVFSFGAQEHHNGNEGLVVNATAMNQVVYIFRCTNTVVQVKGKLSSIVMDSCKKTAVVFDNLVGPIEFVTCQGCKMQVSFPFPTK